MEWGQWQGTKHDATMFYVMGVLDMMQSGNSANPIQSHAPNSEGSCRGLIDTIGEQRKHTHGAVSDDDLGHLLGSTQVLHNAHAQTKHQVGLSMLWVNVS